MKSAFSFMTGNVLVLVVCRVILTMSQSLANPYFSLYVLALGGTVQEIGLITAIGGLAGLILYPLGGYVADMRGRVKLVGFSTFAWAASFIFMATAMNWQMVAVGLFIQQLTLFYMPAMNAIMADSIPRGVRGMGYATTIAIPNAVGIVIPYLGGFLIDRVFGGDLVPAMHMSYTISGILAFCVAFIRLKWLKETMITDDNEGVKIQQIPSLLKKSYLSVAETIRWFSECLRTVATIQMITVLFVGIAGPYWVVRAKTVVGLSAYDWGVLLLVAGAFNIALVIPMGRLIDRFGPRKMILGTALIPPIACFLFPFCTSFLQILAVIMFLTIYNCVSSPAYSTLLVGHIPIDRRGRVFSLMGQGAAVTYGGVNMGAVLLFIPGTIGAAIGGYIYDMNNMLPWFILSAALVGCAIFAYKFIKDPDKI
jgi:MFS family permease